MNNLIVEIVDDGTQGRNEVCFSIDSRTKSIDGIRVEEPKREGLIGKFFKRQSNKRYVNVRTGEQVRQSDIVVDCEDVSSEVMFKLTLKLDVETPQKSETENLIKLVQAFRTATLRHQNSGGGEDLQTGPARIFERELRQWLRSRYQRREPLSRLGNTEWQTTQNKEIVTHIASEYGLQAKVKLIIQLSSDLVVDPSTIVAKTIARDSNVDVSLSVRMGCRLMLGKDPFKVPTLKPKQFRSEMEGLMALFVREELSLQEFRFELDWLERLKERVVTHLREFDREVTSFNPELLDVSGNYHQGPYNVIAKDAIFTPSGWSADDAIRFTSNAEFTIKDAARFEVEFSGKDLLKTKNNLEIWLQDALQGAVETCLHEIYRADQGYAELLGKWDSKFRQAIEVELQKRAHKAGLDASTIIAKPDRPEMDLLKSVTISLENLQLPAREPNATLDFRVDMDISVNSFDDIRGILNATNIPLDYISDKIVLPALSTVARLIGYVDFNQYYDVSAPAASDTATPEASAVERFEQAVRDALREHNLTLNRFAPVRLQTEDWRIFNRLSSAPNKVLEFSVKHFVVANEQGQPVVSDKFKIHFNFAITGLSLEKIETFFRKDWVLIKGQHDSEYTAVMSSVSQSLGEKFNANDTQTLNLGNLAGPLGRGAFEALVNRYLNEFLADEFGLSGYAHAVGYKTPDSLKALIQAHAAKIEMDLAVTEQNTRLTKAQLAIETDKKIAKDKKLAGQEIDETYFNDETTDEPKILQGKSGLTSHSYTAASPLVIPKLEDGRAADRDDNETNSDGKRDK